MNLQNICNPRWLTGMCICLAFDGLIMRSERVTMSHGVGFFLVYQHVVLTQKAPIPGEAIGSKIKWLTTDELNPTLAFDQLVVVVIIIWDVKLAFWLSVWEPFLTQKKKKKRMHMNEGGKMHDRHTHKQYTKSHTSITKFGDEPHTCWRSFGELFFVSCVCVCVWKMPRCHWALHLSLLAKKYWHGWKRESGKNHG